MTEESAGGNDRQGRRRRRRPRRKDRTGGPQGARKAKTHGRKRPNKRGKPKIPNAPNAQTGPSPAAKRYFTGELNEFELFCAYHLKLNERGIPANIEMKSVAARFGVAPPDIEEALVDYRIDDKVVSTSDFDVELARLDIKVAPEGIDRVEVARTLFQELLDTGCGTGPVPNVPAEQDSATPVAANSD